MRGNSPVVKTICDPKRLTNITVNGTVVRARDLAFVRVHFSLRSNH